MDARIFSFLLLLGVLILPACAMHQPVENIRERADVHFARGEFEAAAEGYQKIAARYPGDWRAQHRLGVSLLETDDITGARRALELAHSQRPGHAEIADALAETMFRQGDERQLFAFLRERADASQESTAYLRLAHYALEMGDPDSARLALETAIVLNKGRSVEPYVAAADFAEHLGDMDTAVRRLRQAYGINPHDTRVRERLRRLGEVPGPTLALPSGR